MLALEFASIVSNTQPFRAGWKFDDIMRLI